MFRVSGHTSAVETGRWTRHGRGRLPLAERVCRCGEVQMERYVVEQCVLTQYYRHRFAFHTLEDLFINFTNNVMCGLIYVMLLVCK